MLKRKVIWTETPFSRDVVEHENFVKEIIKIMNGDKKTKTNFKVKCTGFELNPNLGPMYITPRKSSDFKRYIIEFSYIDCIIYHSLEVFRNRMGRFLESNGYEFNPVTYAIMSVIHELGHVEFNRIMHESDIYDLYDHIHCSNNNFLSIGLRGHERDLLKEGIHARYLLSGAEMFCDGYAMTYFRKVSNALVEKGLPREILTKKFALVDCIEAN